MLATPPLARGAPDARRRPRAGRPTHPETPSLSAAGAGVNADEGDGPGFFGNRRVPLASRLEVGAGNQGA